MTLAALEELTQDQLTTHVDSQALVQIDSILKMLSDVSILINL